VIAVAEAETSALNRFVVGSAEQYIQTVVLVDDRIYEGGRGRAPARVTKPKPAKRKAALKSAAPSVVADETADQVEQGVEGVVEVSFHDVQNSFAKAQIICSLYQPRNGASYGLQSEVYKLCSMADVIIVDWDLHGDSGANATELVGGLVEQSQREVPQQLRLVLIYTREPNLQAVANRVLEELNRRLDGDSDELPRRKRTGYQEAFQTKPPQGAGNQTQRD